MACLISLAIEDLIVNETKVSELFSDRQVLIQRSDLLLAQDKQHHGILESKWGFNSLIADHWIFVPPISPFLSIFENNNIETKQ